MSALTFTVEHAEAKQHVAAPTIAFRLGIRCDGPPVEALVLRVQIRIEPQWRSYGSAQEPLLEELFGTPDRWGKTLRALAWADVPVLVPAFENETSVEMNVACTFDFDVTATRFFSALADGDVPLRFFFSGSVFRRAEAGFSTEMVDWACESAYRMPLSVWNLAMRACLGDAALIRVNRQVFEDLHRFRSRNGCSSWEQAFALLLAPSAATGA